MELVLLLLVVVMVVVVVVETLGTLKDRVKRVTRDECLKSWCC